MLDLVILLDYAGHYSVKKSSVLAYLSDINWDNVREISSPNIPRLRGSSRRFNQSGALRDGGQRDSLRRSTLLPKKFFTFTDLNVSKKVAIFKQGSISKSVNKYQVNTTKANNKNNTVHVRGTDKCHSRNCSDHSLCKGRTISIDSSILPMSSIQGKLPSCLIPKESKEYLAIVKTITDDQYLTSIERYHPPTSSNPCLAVPAIDFTNMNSVQDKFLESLYSWRRINTPHLNWLIFTTIPKMTYAYSDVNMCPNAMIGTMLRLREYLGNPVIAGAYFRTNTYRFGYDIAIPLLNPRTADLIRNPKHLTSWDNKDSSDAACGIEGNGKMNSLSNKKREWLIINTQILANNVDKAILSTLARDLSQSDLMLFNEFFRGNAKFKNDFHRLKMGKYYEYVPLLKKSNFCLILPNCHLTSLDISEAMMTGCIPVIVWSDYILPFEEVLDYSKFSIRISASQLTKTLPSFLRQKQITDRIDDLREQGSFIWHKYFSSIQRITTTTLRIIDQRTNPKPKNGTKSLYYQWNYKSRQINRTKFGPILPLPRMANRYGTLKSSPVTQGFISIVLTFDRWESCKNMIRTLLKVPSNLAILVIWNNPNLKHPSINTSEFHNPLNRPIMLSIMTTNELGNRFLPLKRLIPPEFLPKISIPECVLSIDDDIDMLTVDELEFGFQTWKQMPDHIVGFPGRVHSLDPLRNHYSYDAEWKPNISVILTGAAFYHRHYHHLYTHLMPEKPRRFVNNHFNCEDLAINFLIADISGNPPIKVTSRQKFVTSKVSKETGLSKKNYQHKDIRSYCLNLFAQHFGHRMPLKTVEFRFDPVLFKIKPGKNVKSNKKTVPLFPNVGQL
ncbi:unnamed protein product [Gordionus sp. m RMFG-2023]